MSKFINYLTERVIETNSSYIKQRVAAALSGIQDNSRGAMFHTLGNTFKSDNIYFTLLRDNPEVIEGEVIKSTRKIFIDIGSMHVLFTPIPTLIEHLTEIISHELVHREQLVRSGGKAKYERLESTREGSKKYLANKHEIMAYANQAVVGLRHEGYSDAEIIDMCKNPKAWIDRLENSRTHLDIYLADCFESSNPVAKRFRKYVVAYLEKK